MPDKELIHACLSRIESSRGELVVSASDPLALAEAWRRTHATLLAENERLQSEADTPVCEVEAKCWPDGRRYEVVVQVMYYTNPAKGRGSGPFFRVGYVRTQKEAEAEAEVAEINQRLQNSKVEIKDLLRKPA